MAAVAQDRAQRAEQEGSAPAHEARRALRQRHHQRADADARDVHAVDRRARGRRHRAASPGSRRRGAPCPRRCTRSRARGRAARRASSRNRRRCRTAGCRCARRRRVPRRAARSRPRRACRRRPRRSGARPPRAPPRARAARHRAEPGSARPRAARAPRAAGARPPAKRRPVAPSRLKGFTITRVRVCTARMVLDAPPLGAGAARRRAAAKSPLEPPPHARCRAGRYGLRE